MIKFNLPQYNMELFDIVALVRALNTDWKDVLLHVAERHAPHINSEMNKEIDEFSGILSMLPRRDLTLHAFNQFNVDDLKVVILGQDVYPTAGDGMGLCFSVAHGKRCPPSLRNIFKEIENEYGVQRKETDLTDWAQQGVLMLNTALTVREGSPGKHIKIWKDFTTDIIKHIADHHRNLVYMLWGEHAISYSKYITLEHNCILTHSHPSPLSRRPFTGCGHFKACNEALESYGKSRIIWV